MTVSSTTSRASYAGNGSTRDFAVPFLFIAAADVQAVLRYPDGSEAILLRGTHYSLEGEGNPYGGTLRTSTAPLAGETLVIRRNPAILQEVDYMENGPFPAETHERALDRLTMICQSLSERLDRSVSLRISSAVSDVKMPDPQEGCTLCWSGDDIANGPTGEDVAAAQTNAAIARISSEEAQAARDEAVQAASTSSLPDMTTLTGCEMLRVTPDALSYEHRTAAQVRSDIGAPGIAVPNLWTAPQEYEQTALVIEAGVVTWDMAAAPRAMLTLTSNVTAISITNPGPGELTLAQDATGDRSVAWPASIRWPGGAAPAVTDEPGAEDVVTFFERGGVLRGTALQNFKAVA
ncbi:hypothetical protein [Desulfovibrio oxyclinae]|uniref:hypothetical protein n=1 Tax=Desulfovibrio oxyclinae TaxID=63560 RepID=UPI000376E634|nr:hypothetical protein [Desulfovibrio oxyclinae]